MSNSSLWATKWKSTSHVYLAEYQHRPDSSGVCEHLSKTHNTVFLWQINTPILAPSPPALHLVPSPFSSPFLWENWSVRMELYQAADRVICPRSLPSPHFWHMNKKCSLFVLLHCGISLKEHVTQGSHEAAGRQIGAGSRLVAITYPHRCPKKISKHFQTWILLYWYTVKFYGMTLHII